MSPYQVTDIVIAKASVSFGLWCGFCAWPEENDVALSSDRYCHSKSFGFLRTMVWVLCVARGK